MNSAVAAMFFFFFAPSDNTLVSQPELIGEDDDVLIELEGGI